MLTGKIWLKVPETIKVIYKGILPKNIVAKDLILALEKNWVLMEQRTKLLNFKVK